jgi:hypothetical protein
LGAATPETVIFISVILLPPRFSNKRYLSNELQITFAVRASCLDVLPRSAELRLHGFIAL